MRSALYYPHTQVDDVGLVKTSLLLWDRLEYIVPWQGFGAAYSDPQIAEAMELIGAERCPDELEKREAHTRIKEFVDQPLPSNFYMRRGRDWRRKPDQAEDYEMYPEKLLPETWDVLERARMAGKLLPNADYPLRPFAGLTVMSILADCCAGTTRSRVTDRGDAYATVATLLGNASAENPVGKAEAHGQLVPISLQVIDAATIDFEALIRLRKREQTEAGSSLRDLRHRYLAGLEGYVNQLVDTKTTKADAEEIKRRFADDMERDLRDLKTELGYARTDVFTSKEFVATVLTAVGTAASWLAGIHLQLEGVITLGGAPVTVGGMVAAKNKYFKEREAVLKKHPMAYLYRAELSQ